MDGWIDIYIEREMCIYIHMWREREREKERERERDNDRCLFVYVYMYVVIVVLSYYIDVFSGIRTSMGKKAEVVVGNVGEEFLEEFVNTFQTGMIIYVLSPLYYVYLFVLRMG